MIDDFRLEYPNSIIDSKSQDSYTDLFAKTNMAISIGTTPNIVLGYPDHFASILIWKESFR
jgi:hypothetical protein